MATKASETSEGLYKYRAVSKWNLANDQDLNNDFLKDAWSQLEEQDQVNPPSFAFWVNSPRTIHFSYRRYLENEIRKKYGFTGTSIKLYFNKIKGRQEKK